MPPVAHPRQPDGAADAALDDLRAEDRSLVET